MSSKKKIEFPLDNSSIIGKIGTMNLNVDKADRWMFALGVKTLFRSPGSIFVSKEDVNCLGTAAELLASLHTEVGNKKLFWNAVEETTGWYVLESF